MLFEWIFVVGIGVLTLLVAPKKFFGKVLQALVVTGLLAVVLDWIF